MNLPASVEIAFIAVAAAGAALRTAPVAKLLTSTVFTYVIILFIN
jgi:hypothetical protein